MCPFFLGETNIEQTSFLSPTHLEFASFNDIMKATCETHSRFLRNSCFPPLFLLSIENGFSVRIYHIIRMTGTFQRGDGVHFSDSGNTYSGTIAGLITNPSFSFIKPASLRAPTKVCSVGLIQGPLCLADLLCHSGVGGQA